MRLNKLRKKDIFPFLFFFFEMRRRRQLCDDDNFYATIIVRSFPFIHFLDKIQNQSNSSSSIRRISATPFDNHVIHGHPVYPFDGQSLPPFPSRDIVTQIKPHCWKVGELIGRSRASSSKLALPRNLWAARGMPMLPIEAPPPPPLPIKRSLP